MGTTMMAGGGEGVGGSEASLESDRTPEASLTSRIKNTERLHSEALWFVLVSKVISEASELSSHVS